MLIQGKERIEKIWFQPEVAVTYRRGKGKPLLVRLPYHPTNRHWLQNGRRNKPKWNNEKKYWTIPYAWLDDTIKRSLERWGSMYLIQPYREQEKCARACWEAGCHECSCSCGGANHGSQNPYGRWHEVSETFATRWHNAELACRLLTKKP